MYSIVSSEYESRHLETFGAWIQSEWGIVSTYTGTVEGIPIPVPILAIEGEELLGGLGFTVFTKPDSKKNGIWINTLLVAPKHRKKGIGSQLIKAAESHANSTKVHELFVYTDKQCLYEKLGWTIVDDTKESKVLRKTLTKCGQAEKSKSEKNESL